MNKTHNVDGVEIEEDVSHVDIRMDVTAYKPQDRLLDCDQICLLLRIPQHRCNGMCEKLLCSSARDSLKPFTEHHPTFTSRPYLGSLSLKASQQRTFVISWDAQSTDWCEMLGHQGARNPIRLWNLPQMYSR
ncbi:hypothetical protein CAPTEDRAFT_198466 [Capitella teleta]|uniref:Uncharacterized protein n=1 Tax=Capitella teleta TaxID=283909 RepID=R7TMF4_CAPTE|nr:hypothetical protein CAPTEDRAFT_198466 [Capitella teleta]|eukprot:ELT94717.1 hypothetical protein CAPTEDRAFT_198466 [Capitella teleta]